MNAKDIQRFETKFTKGDGCWNWLGSFFKHGYGAFFLLENGKETTKKASRLSWLVYRGPIADGLMVLHKCDNKACINPDHLYLGDHTQNMKDSKERKTHRSGERHYLFKTDERTIKRVKALRSVGLSIKQIETLLFVGNSVVYRAIRAHPAGPYVYNGYGHVAG